MRRVDAAEHVQCTRRQRQAFDRAILTGESDDAPRLSFLEAATGVAPGDRVVTSGDGGVFPPDLPVGVVAVIGDFGARVQVSADYERLEFVRVLRYRPSTKIDAPGGLILPEAAIRERAE